jgi:exodeoxyribonuclease V alpha subunit
MTCEIRALLSAGWLEPVDALFAETLGRLAQEHEPLALLGAAVARAHSARGHVCADLRGLGGRPISGWEGEALDLGDWPATRAWRAALDGSGLVSRDDIAAPLVVFGDRVYLHKHAVMEARLADEISRRGASRCDGVDEAALEAGLVREFGVGRGAAPDGQREAAARAVENRLSAVTGGPGTGKTTVLARCLALIAEQTLRATGRFPRIALAAPTGKAAARMGAAIGACKRDETPTSLRCGAKIAAAIPASATTLHRLLGYRARPGDKFAFGRARRLPADVIVVDEASMVGLELMTALFDAAPDGARVILVGDRDQLASVQAGAVLGDICGAAAPWLTVLDRSYRFGGELGELARAVNRGDVGAAIGLLTVAPRGELVLEEPIDLRAACDRAAWRAVDRFFAVSGEAEPAARLAALSREGLLCAHRNGPLGSLHVNREVETILAARGARRPGEAWYDGRPVMALRNSPHLGIFNGDLGVACRDPSTGALLACFAGEDGAIRRVEPGRLGEHETAFAITVHKAQGSEFDDVLVVLPPAPSPVTTRELLYTAITRARDRVEILGRREVVAAAIEARTVRLSGLADRLRGE